MKLVSRASSLFLLSKLASTTSTGYSSTCTDDGFLQITIPYTNSVTSELLSAVAPSCTARGPSSEHHTYTFDETNGQAVLSLNIDSCGLGEIYHESRLRSGDEYFMAAANVTIGVHDEENDRDLIFYNAFLGAECGQKVDYTVTFDYSQKIHKHEESGCHEFTPDGQCIVAAYESYNFIFREYSSGDFEVLVGDDAVHRANNMIYLQIEALDLPESKKFAVKKCDFLDTITDADGVVTTERYNMFNAAEGTCANRYIELAFGYDFLGSQTADQMAAQISHRLFLLAQGDQDSYDLECEIKVCDKNDHDSDCNSWTACLEVENDHGNYVCEAACEVDEVCAESSGNAVCSPSDPCSICAEGTTCNMRTGSAVCILATSSFSNLRFVAGADDSIDGGVGAGLSMTNAIDGDYTNMLWPLTTQDTNTWGSDLIIDVSSDKLVGRINIFPRRDAAMYRYTTMSVELNDGAVVCRPVDNYIEAYVSSLGDNEPLVFDCGASVVVTEIRVTNKVNGEMTLPRGDMIVQIAELEAVVF